MARRTPPEENIPLIVFKPFVWRNFPPRKPPAPPPSNIPVMSAAPAADPIFHQPFTRYDGHILGADREYPPGTPLSAIHGVGPKPPGGPPTQKIIYVNGIQNSPADAYESLHEIANRANAEVVGIYNATEGGFKDFCQCIMDKLGIGHNPAVETLRDTLYAELTSGSQQPINLMAHSQGALITSRALGDVRNQLKEDGLSPKEIDARMSRINVDTFGGAAWTYPDGPHYNHYVNAVDVVPQLTGQGALLQTVLGTSPAVSVAAEVAHKAGVIGDPGGGEGSQEHVFVDTAANLHQFTAVYAPHWTPHFPDNMKH